MHRSSVGLSCALLFLAQTGCDKSCDSERPCDSGRRPASAQSVKQGFAGVSYTHSDVIANGCEDCGFARASLNVWRLQAGPGSDAATTAAGAMARAPDATITVEDRYEHAAEVGPFLVCTQATPHSCAVLTVGEAQLWTVHINHPGDVPTPTLSVFRPDGARDLDAPFEVTTRMDPADSAAGEPDAGRQPLSPEEVRRSDGGSEPAATSTCQPPEPFSGDLTLLSDAEARAVERFGTSSAPYDHRPVALSCFAKSTASCPRQPNELCPGDTQRPFAHCDQNNNICLKDECHCDADCGSGQACLCPDQPGSVFNWAHCVSASCTVDADCEGDLRCVLAVGAECPVLPIGFRCESNTGACRTDADCAAQGGGTCVHDGSDWACSDVSCLVP